MDKHTKYLEEYVDKLSLNSIVSYLEVGVFVGLMGDKEEGIDVLKRGIKKSNDFLQKKEIPKATEDFNPLFIFDNELSEIFTVDLKKRASEEAINYLNNPNSKLIDLSLENIISLLESDIFYKSCDGLYSMGGNIFIPLANSRELKERKYAPTFHPNFINELAVYKVVRLKDISEDIEQFYEKNPLPKPIIQECKVLKDLYYEDKTNNIKKWIDFELAWSKTSIKIYQHFIKNYIKDLFENKKY